MPTTTTVTTTKTSTVTVTGETNTRVLEAYLVVERLMMDADDSGDVEAADHMRDALGPLWDALTSDDRRALDERTTT